MDESRHFESLYPEDTRFEEIQKIFEYVKSGKSCELIALPGTGRSNLLGFLSYNKNIKVKHVGENTKWFHFVYMDFSEVRKRSSFDIIKFILISTAYSLSERGLKTEYETVNTMLKDAIGFQDELILFQALKRVIDYLAIEKELTVIFLFDRFEQAIPSINEEFFLNLKILRNRAKYRFSCIFSLTRALEVVLDTSIYSEFFEFFGGNDIYLKMYDKAGTEFRFSYIEKVTGKKTDKATKEKVIELTGGHGKLTRLAYEAVLSSDTKIKGLKQYLFKKNTIQNALFEVWNSLTPREQATLKDISEQKKTDHIPTYLEDTTLIQDGKITIPLLEELAQTSVVESREKIKFNPETNEIYEGEDPITERLSPSEFRLLRFLIQNSERICEKDEVIQTVWKETRTQEGVTDQALDQIIYRLRKKIEKDPNNPIHLQTIKGRGFKFIP